MGAALKEQILLGHMVVSQHLAVVCGKDDPGVFEQVIFSQTAKDTSQCIVDLCDAGIVGAFGSSALRFAEQIQVRVFISACKEALRGLFNGSGPVACNRVRHRDVVIQLPEVTAGIKGRMGLGKTCP